MPDARKTGTTAEITARGRGGRIAQDHPRYKWVALSNTTLGMLLATVNSSIVIISMPAIFRGIGLDPLRPGNVGYLLQRARLTGKEFFPHLISGPVHQGLLVVFSAAALMMVVGAVASLLDGGRPRPDAGAR